MKSTNMELQAIREKLQLLQAEPPAAETLAIPLPWSEAKAKTAVPSSAVVSDTIAPEPRDIAQGKLPRTAPMPFIQSSAAYADRVANASPPASASVSQSVSQSPQEIAIETLKQRSRGTDQAANARMDNLVAQEIYRLEVQANNINERSRQQAADIMALKRSAQQASVGLRRQGIHDHPQLAAITQFLENYPSAAVPHITRDSQGHFALMYDTVDFHRAQQDAIATAQALRSRQHSAQPVALSHTGLQTAPFEHPIESSLPPNRSAGQPYSHHNATDAESNNAYEMAETWLKVTLSSAFNGCSDLLAQITSKRPRRRIAAAEGFHLETSPSFADEWEEGPIDSVALEGKSAAHLRMDRDYHANQFSWLDGTIWFSAAAIARIAVQAISVSYPLVPQALLLLLVGVILFALYRVVIEKSNDYSLVYRLCIGMVGLVSAGLF